jgi:PEP-CTERM motif-containing protein
MGPIRINKFLLLLLVVQALGYIQSATAGLIVFDSKPAFLAAAPIETTQDFESFASPTLFAVPQVAFDQVVFSATPTPSIWIIDNSVGLMRTNTLGTAAIVRQEIGFGEGRYVNAFGFTFLGGGSTNGVAARYDIGIMETDGSATTLSLSLIAGTYYFGFLSNAGIGTISVDPVPANGGTVFWRYDDFSRSSISAVPEPSTPHLLLMGVVVLLACFSIQRPRASKRRHPDT